MATSIAERLRAEVLSRLKVPTAVVPKAASIRRSHLVETDRTTAPAVYVIEGPDEPIAQGKSSNCPRRRLSLTVRLILRNDAGTSAADQYVIEIARRLDPFSSGYGEGVTAALGTIAPAQEVADADVVEVNIDLTLDYQLRGEFALT